MLHNQGDSKLTKLLFKTNYPFFTLITLNPLSIILNLIFTIPINILTVIAVVSLHIPFIAFVAEIHSILIPDLMNPWQSAFLSGTILLFLLAGHILKILSIIKPD